MQSRKNTKTDNKAPCSSNFGEDGGGGGLSVASHHRRYHVAVAEVEEVVFGRSLQLCCCWGDRGGTDLRSCRDARNAGGMTIVEPIRRIVAEWPDTRRRSQDWMKEFNNCAEWRWILWQELNEVLSGDWWLEAWRWLIDEWQRVTAETSEETEIGQIQSMQSQILRRNRLLIKYTTWN